MTIARSLGSLLLVSLVAACAADATSDPPARADSDYTTVGAAGAIKSPNAVAGARYMDARPVADLRSVGALTPDLDALVTRILGMCRPSSLPEPNLSATALLCAEEPAHYATYLPAEKASFPQLWKMLEIDASIDLAAKPVLDGVDTFVNVVEPVPQRLEEAKGVAIASLPESLRVLAQRVPKAATTTDGSIAFADVARAAQIGSQGSYTFGEWSTMPKLLDAVTALRIGPSEFPHLALTQPVEKTRDVAVGPATLHVARTGRATCMTSSIRDPGVSVGYTVQLDVPAGTAVTWVPLSDDALPTKPDVWSYPAPAPTAYAAGKSALYGMPPAMHRPRPSVAILEAWQGGQRTAQIAVVFPSERAIGGANYAIVENGAFTCMPDVRDDLYRTVTLPPGRYPFAAGTYGTGYLDVYGWNVLRTVIGGKTAWLKTGNTYLAPDARASMCSEYTGFGPTNVVTGTPGAGPGVQVIPEKSTLLYLPQSYGACSTYAPGSPLTAATRL